LPLPWQTILFTRGEFDMSKLVDRIKYLYSIFGINGVTGVTRAIKAKLTNSNILMTVNRKDIRFPFYLRCPNSDLPTYNQIFIDQDYDFIVEECPRVIVDAGANIGLVSIYFANKYPES